MFDIEKAHRKGMSERSIAIMEKINENTRKRQSCSFHSFEMQEPFTGKYVCKNCGCVETSEYVSGYHDGFIHAESKAVSE